MSEANDYLEHVMANQQRVELDLRAKRKAVGRNGAAAMTPRIAVETASTAVDVRITGFWRWKTVIVPPNAHVVHTRRGYDRPLHLGLGVSFRYNPAKDTFLVVPGTMQTILINAYCICRELQGLLVQGYVQWIIHDFATAYRKLDFTDTEDPMRVVNVQLREQAEAAIKDKVATMSIDEVLSDKQPIIEELTARLRSVAEGEGTDKGLGLRIVTVQIKEAVVSSKRVWEALQQPFRAERSRVARIAEIEADVVISARERTAGRERETAQLETQAELAKLRAMHEADVFDREQAEATRRVHHEQELARQTTSEQHATTLHAVELDKVRIERESEVAKLRALSHAETQRLTTEATIGIQDLQRAATNRQTETELTFLETRQRVANETSQGNLQAKLIEVLPTVAEKLPKPTELRSISIGANGHDQSLASLVAQMLAIVEGFRGGVRD